MCIPMHKIVINNSAQNSSDNLPSYPPQSSLVTCCLLQIRVMRVALKCSEKSHLCGHIQTGLHIRK